MFSNYFEIIPIVAETKSFSKAGRLLHLSQPAISSKIKDIEDYYGIQFFNRTPQGVTLTEAGKILNAYAVRFSNLQRSLDHELTQLVKDKTPSLTIGCSCTAGNYAMPGTIRAFKEICPEASIKLLISNTKEALRKLDTHDVDVIVVEGKIDHPELTIHKIGAANLVLITPYNSKNRIKSVVSLHELKSRPLVIREEGAAVRREFEDAISQYGYTLADFNIATETTSIHSVKAAVEDDLGWAIVPAIAVTKEVEHERLRVAQIKEFDLEMDISLAYIKNQEASFITRRFVKFMTNNENCIPSWDLNCQLVEAK